MLEVYPLENIELLVVIEQIDFLTNNIIFRLFLIRRHTSIFYSKRIAFSYKFELYECLELSNLIIFESEGAISVEIDFLVGVEEKKTNLI